MRIFSFLTGHLGHRNVQKDTLPGVAMVPANPRHRSTPRSVPQVGRGGD